MRDLSTVWLLLLLLGGALAVALPGLLYARRRFPPCGDPGYANAAGNVFQVVGNVYAVLLAFVVIVVWQSYSAAQLCVTQEANATAELERMSRAFPVVSRREVQEATRAYLQLVAGDEWRLLRKGEESPLAHAALVEIWNLYADMPPELQAHPMYAESLELLQQIGENRRLRILAAREAVPPVLWLVLVACGFCTLVLLYRMNVPELRQHMVLTTLYAVVVAFILFLTAALDNPFRPDLGITPQAYSFVLEHMQNLDR